MKILQINDIYSLVGGTEKTLQISSDYLEKIGHEIVIVHSDKISGELRKVRKEYQVPTLFSRKSRHRPQSWSIIEKILILEDPDVIHVRSCDSKEILVKLAQVKPVVRTIHTMWGYCPNGMRYLPKIERVCTSRSGMSCLTFGLRMGCPTKMNGSRIDIMRWIRQILFCFETIRNDRRLDKIIVTSNYMKEQVIRDGLPSEKVAVIAPPAEIPHLASSAKLISKEQTILFVGRLFYAKGLHHLLRAMTALPDPVKLFVVGDGPDRLKNEALAKQLELSHRIKFFGWRNYENLANFYARSSVVVIPSLLPEIFGNVGIEAMAYQKPVVAYDIGGIRDWLIDGRTGYLAKPSSIEDLAGKIDLCLSDPAKSVKMGENGRRRVEELFSAELHAKRMEALYKEVIEGRNGLLHNRGDSK